VATILETLDQRVMPVLGVRRDVDVLELRDGVLGLGLGRFERVEDLVPGGIHVSADRVGGLDHIRLDLVHVVDVISGGAAARDGG
jgi:hypothetical protein